MGANDTKHWNMLMTAVSDGARADRDHGNPVPTDAALWQTAQGIAAGLGASALPDDADADTLADLRDAYIEGRRRVPNEASDFERLDAAVEKALEGMWGAVVVAYPECTTGDFGPLETTDIENVVRDVMQLWLYYNQPDDGLAPTAAAAQEIVAARRAADTEQVTPPVSTVDEDDRCDDVDEDGEICGAPSTTVEGWDSKCGNCADRIAAEDGEA
jgi:hypothetical protein